MRSTTEMTESHDNKGKSLPIIRASSIYDFQEDWALYDDDVYINNALFNIGVTAVVPASEANWLTKINPDNIHFYGQTSSSDMINDTLRVSMPNIAINPANNLPFPLSDSESLSGDTDSVSSEFESSKRVLMYFSKNSLPKPESQKPKSSSLSPGEFTDYEVSLFSELKSPHHSVQAQELSLPKRRELRHSIYQNMRCLDILAKYANKKNASSVLICKDHHDQFLICNPERRSEVFLPISVNGMGSYICLSNNKIDNSFTGVNDFVTAGCLFGATLEARNNAQGHYPLIKHEKTFFPGEYIVGIIYNRKQSGAYEDSLFFELTKLCHLIDALSDKDKPKNLTFHIPYYDYILYAFKLYLDSNITQKACDEFIGHIFFKTEQYIRKITELCAKHNIHVTCVSPFINLFGNHIDISTPSLNLTKALFEKLKFPIPDTTSPNLPLKKHKITEKDFVQCCLRQLMENNLNMDHQRVWQDFMRAHAKDYVQKYLQKFEERKLKSKPQELELTETDKLFLKLVTLNANNYTVEDIISIGSVNTLEDLLKIANAIIIGIASKGQHANKICSALPQTERIIQSSYAQLRNKEALRDNYAPVLNITTLDPLLAYSGATNGSVFYLDLAAEKVCELINRKNILAEASQNIHQAICGRTPNAISQIVNNGDSPRTPSPKSISSSPENQMNLSPPSALSSVAKIINSLATERTSSPNPVAFTNVFSSTNVTTGSYDTLRNIHKEKNKDAVNNTDEKNISPYVKP